METASLVHALESCLQEELAAQKRTQACLDAQERAIRGGAAAELTRALEALAAELARNAARGSRRRVVLRKLAEAWGVAPGVLTLGSVAERAGERARRLRDLRAELRAATAGTLRKNRRLAALSRAHRKVVGEVLQAMLGGTPGTPLGALLDAEA